MYIFQDSVKKILLESGWFQGRKIDTTNYGNFAKKEGYPWFGIAEEFLSEFGDLKLFFHKRNGRNDLLHFNMIKAMQDFDLTWIKEDYSRRLNTDILCVIGQAYDNHMTIIMDSEGKVYGSFDDSLFFIANSGQNSIETICLDLSLQEIK